MTEQIYIDGMLMDTDADSKGVQLVYQSPYFTDIESIVSNRTNNVTLPLTERNKKAVGIMSAQVQDVFPYRKHKVIYLRDGVQLFSGTATMLSVTTKGISMCFVWGNNEVFKPLFERSLRSLTDATHAETYVSSASNANLPALVDCGGGRRMPAIMVSNVLTRIKQMCGVTFTNHALWDKLALQMYSLNGDSVTKERQGVRYGNYGLRVWPWGDSLYYITTLTLGSSGSDAHQSMNEYGVIDTTTADTIRLKFNGSFDLNLYTSASVADYPLKMRLLKQTDEGWQAFSQGYEICTSTNLPDAGSKHACRFTFNVNEEIDVRDVNAVCIAVCLDALNQAAAAPSIVRSTTSSNVIIIDPDTMEEVVWTTPTNVGDAYPLYANLPDITCGQFLKNLMLMCGMFAYCDDAGQIKFTTLTDLFTRKAMALDWTDRMLTLQAQTTEYKLQDLTQRNWFRYAADDGLAKGVCDDYLPCDNMTLEYERDAFTSDMALAYENRVPVWLQDAEGEWNYEGDCVARFLYCINNTLPILSARFSDLMTWRSLLATYYAEYAQVILHPVVIKASVTMRTADLQALDLTRPIYLKQTGHYYCIRQLTTKGDNTADVELIQL